MKIYSYNWFEVTSGNKYKKSFIQHVKVYVCVSVCSTPSWKIAPFPVRGESLNHCQVFHMFTRRVPLVHSGDEFPAVQSLTCSRDGLNKGPTLTQVEIKQESKNWIFTFNAPVENLFKNQMLMQSLAICLIRFNTLHVQGILFIFFMNS